MKGASGSTKQIVFSVKAGQNVSVAMVRDLGHVVARENAQIGVLLSLVAPTQPMRTEAAGAGFYTSPVMGTNHPRLQIITVEDLLAGKQVDYPRVMGQNVSFVRKAAPRTKKDDAGKDGLF
jgi:hypothetical protein